MISLPKLKRTIALLAVSLFMSSCFGLSQNHRKAKVEDRSALLNSEQESLIETIPMMNPAVQEMYDLAIQSEAEGDDRAAINHLKRAYEIQPKTPLVTQKLAEIFLKLGDFQQSFSWSRLAAMNGPSKGKMCEKSWNILALSAEQLAELPAWEHAQKQAELCIEKPMERF